MFFLVLSAESLHLCPGGKVSFSTTGKHICRHSCQKAAFPIQLVPFNPCNVVHVCVSVGLCVHACVCVVAPVNRGAPAAVNTGIVDM